MKYISHIVIALLVCVIIAVGIFLQVSQSRKDAPKLAESESLAQCLVDNNAIFYGAFWCPACAEQKALFGSAAKKLPYVECASRDNNSEQLPVCVEENIKTYPTWKFANGMQCTGVLSEIVLAAQAGCPIPIHPHARSQPSAFERVLTTILIDTISQSSGGDISEIDIGGELAGLREQLEQQGYDSIDDLTEREVAELIATQAGNCVQQPDEDIEITESELDEVEGEVEIRYLEDGEL